MRTRPSARLLILDPQRRVLLFRFIHNSDALAGRDYWATPGGGLEAGESFADAAIRECFEETGIVRYALAEPVAESRFPMLLPSGEQVIAEERFYLVCVADNEIDTQGWSASEQGVITSYRWWSLDELMLATDTIYPLNLRDILINTV